jgi:hypothetical protein
VFAILTLPVLSLAFASFVVRRIRIGSAGEKVLFARVIAHGNGQAFLSRGQIVPFCGNLFCLLEKPGE